MKTEVLFNFGGYMAKLLNEVSHTFNEYLLIPGHTSKKCVPDNVSLAAPLVRYKKGQKSPLTINIPHRVVDLLQSIVTLACHYHPKYFIYIRVHSWSCIFYGF